jgi:hypothetical protein
MTITATDSPELKFKEGDEVKFQGLDGKGATGVVIDFLWDGYWSVNVAGKPRLLHEVDDSMQLVEKQAPAVPAFGMSSAQLAEAVAEAITRATSRVVGVGQDQYDEGTHQRFETMPLTDLLEMTLEELDDVIVYAVMQQIRFRRIAEAINKAVD